MDKTYTYAVARIRALEARMLSPVQLSRMIEAPDLDRAFFVLNETIYADHISASIHPFDFEKIVEVELQRVHSFLNCFAGDDPGMRILWRRYDYCNVKVLIRLWALKGEQEGITDLLSEFGVVNKEDVVRYILKGEGTIPAWLEKVINDAIVAFEEEKSPAAIDRVIDRAYLKDLERSENPLLKKLAVMWRERTYPFDLEGDNKTVECLRHIKRRSFGIEPLITYWLVKELEAKTIRQVLVIKKHNLRLGLIKDRGKVMYV